MQSGTHFSGILLLAREADILVNGFSAFLSMGRSKNPGS